MRGDLGSTAEKLWRKSTGKKLSVEEILSISKKIAAVSTAKAKKNLIVNLLKAAKSSIQSEYL